MDRWNQFSACLLVALFVTHLGKGVLRVEANRWKCLGLLFYIAQECFGVRKIAALCEQLRFKEIAELNIEETSPACLARDLASSMYFSAASGCGVRSRRDASAWST